MKRTFIVFGIAAMSVFVMMSCGSKDASKDKESTEQVADENVEADDEADEDEAAPKTEEGVIAMLQQAYADANLVSKPEDDMEPNLDLFGMYCSKDLNDKVEQIRSIEVSTGDKFEAFPDLSSFFIYWEGSTATMKDASAWVDGDTASASYVLTNGEEEMETSVNLVYEDGQWRIDNWEQIGKFGIDPKGTMEDFIEAHK